VWTAIVNPTAGRSRIPVSDLRDVADVKNLDIAFHETPDLVALESVIAQAVGSGCLRFVAVGGDGTAHALVNVLLRHYPEQRFTVAVIASGSGSDLVRTFGHGKSLDEGFGRLVDPDLYPMDIGTLTVGETTKYFLNAANVGVGAASAAVAASMPRFLGGFRYIAAFWIALARYRMGTMQVSVNHHRFAGSAINVVIANGQFFGGGMNIAPRASTADGLFDVQVFSGRKRLAFTVMPRVLLGNHLTHRAVHRYIGDEVSVTGTGDLVVEADGEVIGRGAATFGLIPGAIDLVV